MSKTRALAGVTALSAFSFAMFSGSKKSADGSAAAATTTDASGKVVPAAPPAKKFMTSEEFNASQDQDGLKKCMNALEVRQKALAAGKTPTNDKDLCMIELYRFLSCPYCAKVKGVLDYNNVPYRTVTVDPITYNHMPKTPYSQAPQVQFVTNPDAAMGTPARGPFVVDSDLIVATLAAPLGFEKELKEPRVNETLQFISNAYSRASFVASYSSLNRAMEAYRHCVPDHYQYLPLRAAGAFGMSFIATKKAFPKIKDHFPVTEGESIDSVVERQTKWFTDRIATGKPFHGGDKPDIADVQMYAMSTSLLANPLVAPVIKKGAFDEWAAKMGPMMPNRSTANYGCEMPRL